MFIEQYDMLSSPMIAILDHEGNCNEALKPKIEDDLVGQMYEEMVFCAMADDKILKLQRQGRMGTYASIKGEEACQIASAHCLSKTDWMVPAFRELAAMYIHGVPLLNIFQYWGGFEIGNKIPENVNCLPISIPVATHLPHAVGIAWALKMQKKGAVVLAYFSDGGTSPGDFHEAMNFAGVFKAPCIFFCKNNQYAISTPRRKQTASKTLAMKALAYGFKGIQIDGNDIFAVYAVTKEVTEYVKKNQMPYFIEAVTYRLADHTTSDDASKYRSKEELMYWEAREPIRRLRIYLKSKNLWTEKLQSEIETKSKEKIDKIVREYEATPLPKKDDIFKYVYENPTAPLLEQYQNLIEYGESNNG